MGTVTSRIDADALTIESVFQSFYAIPPFQREYVWTKKHVTKLLGDVYGACRNGSSDTYFLGSIVHYEDDNLFQLIDGQQRMTTLFILIASIRDRLKALGVEEKDLRVLQNALIHPFFRDGKTVDTFRVELQYKELHEILESIGQGEGPPDAVLPKGASSQRNLVNAYTNCTAFIEETFKDDKGRLQELFGYLWQRVELIVIQTQDIKTAFTIFETINDRGVGLDAMDLLKNLLFRETDGTGRKKLKENWSATLGALKDVESKPVRFLRYFMVGSFDFDKMPTAKGLFDWIIEKENAAKLGYGADPVAFSNTLKMAAKAYSNFLAGKNAKGSHNDRLRRIEYQKTGVRQHLCLLLAARHLPQDAFDLLCQELETLVFMYAATNVQWNRLEGFLPSWTKELRKISSLSGLETFIEKNVRPEIENAVPTFCEKLRATNNMPQRLQMYLLASLSQQISDEMGKGGSFDRHFTEKLTVEHVFPQTPEENVKDAFGLEGDEDEEVYIYSLGNLALLHRSPNSSASRNTFKKKEGWYAKSDYWLTRSLVAEIGEGKNAMPRKVARKYGFRPYDDWSPMSLIDRHLTLLKLVEQVWGIEAGAAEFELEDEVD